MKKILLLICSLLIIVICCFTGVSLAKYEWKETENVPIGTKPFYFESDVLALNNPSYTLQTDLDKIVIKLRNYADQLRVSYTDINYSVSLSKDSVVLQEKNVQGTITTSEKMDLITFDGLSAGTYVVSATSSSPYVKTIRATFIIPELNNQFSAELNASSSTNMVYVSLTTNDFSGNINIVLPDGLVPDNTNDVFDGAVGNSFSISVEKNSSYNLSFLKNLSTDSYSLSVAGNTITINKV